MEKSLLDEGLFRQSFVVCMIIGVICRGLVLRVSDKQYPSRPQDYLEQVIISGLSASLGAIAFPALIDKEFAALTFFAVAIQQFEGLSEQERITIENIDSDEIVPRGKAYIEEIASTYSARSYISLFSALVASIIYIRCAKRLEFGFLMCTLMASIGGAIVGFIFRRFLRRDSIGDLADVKIAKIKFDGSNLMVNDVFIVNIGLKQTRQKYMDEGIAFEIVPKNLGDFGVISDIGQRTAIVHNLFLHMGINKDVDEKDVLPISRTDLENNSIVMPYIPMKIDEQRMIEIIKSTPIIETSKSKMSDYKG